MANDLDEDAEWELIEREDVSAEYVVIKHYGGSVRGMRRPHGQY